MKRTHRFLSIILAILIVVSTVSITTSAVTYSGTCGDNLTWSYDEVTYTLTISGEGDMYDYEVDTTPYDDVDSENRPWASYASQIKAINIGDRVTSIGDNAFFLFGHIKSVVLPDSITSIGEQAFYYCDELINVKLSNNLTTIGDYAFYRCENLLEVIIPESVTTIGRYAFAVCHEIKSIVIPKNVETIGEKAFVDCYKLENVIVDSNNQYYSSDENGVLFDKDKTILIQYPIGSKNSDYVIPDGVKKIESQSFYWADYLKNITIPDSVTTIESSAFSNCHKLESIVIGNGVTTIGNMAFLECHYLKTIVIGNGVASIGVKAFYGCDEIETVFYAGTKSEWYKIDVNRYNNTLLDATILCNHNYNDATISGNCGESLTWLYDMTTHVLTISGTGEMNDYKTSTRPWNYFAKEIKSVIINEDVTKVGISAFYSLESLESVSLPESLTIIGKNAFRECPKLTAITIPENVTIIDEYAFYRCTGLEDIVIPDKVTTIGLNSFYKCTALKSVILGKSVSDIGINAFYYCNNLEKITIPESVTSIGANAFYSNSLVEIFVDGDNQYYSNDEFGVLFNKDKTTLILYPANNARTSYVIPDSVTTIGDNAFSHSVNLENVSIPDGVTTICNSAFYSCINLNNITIPSSVSTIGGYAFDHCDSFTSVIIPEGVAMIGEGAFYSCDNLVAVVFPDSVTVLGDDLFANCVKLANVTLGKGVTDLGLDTFDSCTSLNNFIIPNGVENIRGGTFANCTSLKSITIPVSVTGIGYGSFEECNNLENVYYLGSEDDWNKLKIYDKNDPLLNATIHYNYTPPFAGIKDNHFYKNDVMQKAYQLVEFDGDFYFIGDRHQIVKNKNVYLNEERINGLTYADGTSITVGHYIFDENGKMVMLDGIVGNKVYKNNTQLKAYQLVEVDGDFYFIGDRHEIIKGKKAYLNEDRINGLTYADGTPITTGYYDFDENGKMVILNGVFGNNIYKNNAKLKAYQLVEVDGDFYFIGDRHEIIKGKKAYLNEDRINGLTYEDGTPITAGYYEFDADGKMIILNGVVGNKIYKNNTQLKAYQLVEVDGDFYFIGDRHEIVKNKKIYLNEARINGLTYEDGTPIKVGYYNVDADGKMIIE